MRAEHESLRFFSTSCPGPCTHQPNPQVSPSRGPTASPRSLRFSLSGLGCRTGSPLPP